MSEERKLILSARNIVKIYDNEMTALNGVSLDIYEGDFVSIIGASGSGKSTLLSIIGGVDKPTSGSVILDGEDISLMNDKQLSVLRKTKLGFVFQFFNLVPYLTVEENIMLPIFLGNKRMKEYEAKLEELLCYLGIADQRKKLPSKMSGGQQQRVAIARSLIFSPPIMMLDEPTGNLDSKSSQEIMDMLVRINKELNVTIVQVTHSDFNTKFGNKIIKIKDGLIAEE